MKTVIITGASSGIGAATAKVLDTGNYRMVLAGRNQARLEEFSATLSSECVLHIGDVKSYSDCQALVAKAKGWGEVDVLVNNAGLGYFDPLIEGNIEQWHDMVDVNVKGLLNCIHAALPSLRASQGQIINLGSVASHNVFPDSGVYCATKHAVLAISESIRIELNGQVKVCTISPGAVDTDFINKTTNEELHTKMKDYFASALRSSDIAAQIKHVIEAPTGAVINEVIIRPFR